MIRRQLLLSLVAGLVSASVGVHLISQSADHRPTRHPWYGISVNENDAQAYPAYLATVDGPAPSVRSIFVKLDSGTTEQRLQRIVAAGQTPFVTVEPWSYKGGGPEQPRYSLASLVAGRDDAAFTTIAHQLAAVKRPVLVRFAHEFNGTWYPWALGTNGNTALEYVAAWRHVHALFRLAGAGNVSWVWSPNVTQQVMSGVSIASAYPGDDVVDYLGMTGYARLSGETPTTTYDTTLTALRRLSSKPVLLSEIGAAGPSRDAWLRGLGPWLLAHPVVRGFIYFSTTPESTGATGDYAIASASSASVWKETLVKLKPRAFS